MAITVRVDSSTQETTVQFILKDGAATGEVSVVGSFNGWSAGVDTLLPQDDGTRSVTVTVPAGQDVRFRYLAAERVWLDNPDADEITAGGSVLHQPGHRKPRPEHPNGRARCRVSSQQRPPRPSHPPPIPASPLLVATG